MNQVNEKTSLLDAQQVAEYLEQNPDFFQDYPELLLHMNTSSEAEGTVSLVERQLKGLRHKNQEMADELAQVILNAQNNQFLLEQTVNLAINLTQAETLEELSKDIVGNLLELFDLPFVSVILSEKSFADIEGEPLANVREALGDHCPQSEPVCGRLPKRAKSLLFDTEEDVGSVALLPLGNNGELGLLSLGSSDPAHFDPEMGDLFLLLITDIVSAVLNRYADRS